MKTKMIERLLSLQIDHETDFIFRNCEKKEKKLTNG